jgi:4-alpha-glucanotransferase
LRCRERSAIRTAQRELANEIDFHRFVQFQFDRQWTALRRYCNERGVALIGDLPIFVGYDSCDVWAQPELFQLQAAGYR